MRSLLRIVGVGCLPALLLAPLFAQEKEAARAAPGAHTDPKPKDWKPAVFPAGAVAYGVELEVAAPPKLKADLETSRKRVESYLKAMAVTHPRMEGIEPSILREFQ
jgi:hypothetical protein